TTVTMLPLAPNPALHGTADVQPGASAIRTERARRFLSGLIPDKVGGEPGNRKETQMPEQPPVSTTDSGAPAPSDAFSLTVGADGPILLHDHHFIQQMAHFNR